jgi:hypothetical protein
MIVLHKNICGSGHPAFERKRRGNVGAKIIFYNSVAVWSTKFLLLKGYSLYISFNENDLKRIMNIFNVKYPIRNKKSESSCPNSSLF